MELTPFVVHDLCKFSDSDSLVGEGSGRQAAQGRVGSIFVVVAPPVLDALAGISQRQEPRGVQAFRPQTAVERLDVGVVGRLARSGEVDLDPIQVGPLVEHAPSELRSIIHPQAFGSTSQSDQGVQGLGHLVGAEVGSRV